MARPRVETVDKRGETGLRLLIERTLNMECPDCFDCKHCRFTVSLVTPKRSYGITLCKRKGLLPAKIRESPAENWCDEYDYNYDRDRVI